jgi:hypothetical protein
VGVFGTPPSRVMGIHRGNKLASISLNSSRRSYRRRVAARSRHRSSALPFLGALAGVTVLGVSTALLAVLIEAQSGGCGSASGGAAQIALAPVGGGQLVGATEYGGPGDSSSGTVGARGDNLVEHPDTYAELGGLTWETATAMGGLPYMTPLRVSWGSQSAIAYKRDFGLGGGPIDGLPRVIDLWWQFAGRLGIPYESGQWSGPVRVARPPDAGAANVLGQTPPPTLAATADSSTCAPTATAAALPLAPGQRAQLLPNGLAAAPQSAPLAVKEIIAAGNQIAGKPYVYGGGHGVPLSEVASAYDSADHVFMYVAGLRWDTHNAAGPGDGSSGIGWHPLVRSSAGFVARHPVGL